MLGGIRYLYEKNYKIGSDIKLCGFNNIHAVRNNIFPLRTWEIDMEKISSLLVEECINNSGINQLIKPKQIKTEELQQ
jgi:DNA-binding LacI/PurR family transcriptional regulator